MWKELLSPLKMRSPAFWSTIIIGFFFITGCAPYVAVYRLPLGNEDLRGLYIKVKKDELWDTEKKVTTSFDEIIETLADMSVIYIGETHSNIAHHKLQLDILEALYKNNPNLIIGMEMFQRPYQEVLNRWTRGELSEGLFLDEVEWYYQWDFPYDYYRPILDFAREKRIPLIAMNIPEDLLAKIKSGGIESLTEEEHNLIPPLTPIDKEYQYYAKNNYKAHPRVGTFEEFLNTARFWDDTMAESVILAMERNPVENLQVVVIAGGGHVIYGIGIPDRVFRHNRLSYATVLPVEVYERVTKVVRSIGTFVVGTEPSTFLPAVPLLGVSFSRDKGESRGVVVKGVMKESVAEKSGIKAGDILINFDGIELRNTHTLKRLIREGGWDRIVEIELLRDDKKIVFEATFPPEPSKDKS